MSRTEFLSIVCFLFFAAILHSNEAFVKRPIGSRNHSVQKRQIGPAYFFSRNVSFGLQPPSPGTEFGPWGPWTESSECSRSCGGGISYQDRICLDVRSDGHHTCIGSSRRYFSCNIQDCPEGSRDFRSEQCAKFNSVPYEGKYYSWLPYYKGQTPCELNCMPRGLGFYTRLSRKVTDGTRCYDDGSLDVCVDGICMPVGCDLILGSTAKEDECRECGGDGSSCQIVKGIFDKDDFEVGYNDILLIPSGATSIHIKEQQPTNNYLAIRNAAGEFYLNGHWRIEFPKELKIAGTVFQYERKPHGSLAPESLRARGPTTEPIFIVLLYQTPNLGVIYEYSIPIGVSTAKPDSYAWTFGDFEECSATCGGGIQYRPVRCVRNSDRETVPEGLCDPSLKPVMNASCNIEPCPARWKIGEWSNCSHPCGGGSQFRLVFCHQVKDGTPVLVDESLCAGESKPLFMRACNEDTECPDWVAGEWTECNQTCGIGSKTRQIECQYLDKNETVDASFCNKATRPSEVEQCTNGPCEGVEWILSDWSGCEGMCSPQMESRSVHCANEEGVVFPDEACEASRLPELTRPCPVLAMCEPMWHASEWTECSVKCGDGVQTRVVFCGVWEENAVLKIDESKCLLEKKFEEMKNCSSMSCDGMWFTGPWSRCSTPCGGGERSRAVLCFHENNVVNDSNCDSNEKPFETEPCNMMPCDGDEVMIFAGCKSSEHGCCPDGVTPARERSNFEGCPKMNITSNTTCAEAEFGCCADEFTLALGPFKKGCPSLQPCNATKYGCCLDKSTPATGPEYAGCPEITDCSNSSFGCCPDGITAAHDQNFTNCVIDVIPDIDPETSGDDCSESGCCIDDITGQIIECNETLRVLDVNCTATEFGCCEDNVTTAKGPFMEGCFEEGSGDFENCNETIFGCCPDNVTAARGFDNEGCNETLDCHNSTYGCCPDNVSFSDGPDFLGCQNVSVPCNESAYGCCPDNVTTAGLDYEGCELINVTLLSSCEETEFGCCPDNTSIAMGPDGMGCNISIECLNSTFGCCPDNITLAAGPNEEGCDKNDTVDCFETEYGCCPDNVTIALGDDFLGCNESTDSLSTTLIPDVEDCENTLFGCCPDLKTLALGPNLEGCCFGLKFGCCPDNLTAALGPQYRGCSCHTYPYGCCPDGVTPAQGYRYHGCRCEHFRYGCCPDNQTPATGANFEGCKCEEMQFGCCPDGITPRAGPNAEGCGCISTRYGCCPDGKTTAVSADLSGCPCDTLPYGCCPDGRTPARTSDHRDCPCDKQRYGCCLDGRTPAQGPNFEGCPCESTRFGCCFDGRTVAHGPDFEGCPCEATQYGCCADGFSRARGPGKQGCLKIQLPEEKVPAEVCSLPKDIGPCRNYSVKWYFDVEYGGCSRFWYGGCSGNGNAFATSEKCEETCVTPEGADACLLPKVVGPCRNKHLSYYYDAGTQQCEAFYYGGCLGNNNRFTNKEQCERTCIMQEPMKHDLICSLPKDKGPCDKNLVRWYYNSVSKRCEQFHYGGCNGNMNRFEMQSQCEEACVSPSLLEEDVCRQPQEAGNCSNFRERWYFDAELSQCHRFYYSGCGGNDNNFRSHYECEKRCLRDSSSTSVTLSPIEDFKIEFCFLDREIGSCSESELQFYYDRTDGVCKEFSYSGCGGNENRFKLKRDCEAACDNSQDVCRLPVVKGPCSGTFLQWYYDHAVHECFEFLYSGCAGNANRFNSKADCEQQCGKTIPTSTPAVTEDVCSLPVEPGPCSDYFKMYYYDQAENQCNIFVYGGCEGNANRFEKRTECEQKCLQRITRAPHPSLSPDTIKTNNEDVCRLPVDPGPCTEAQKRWFYDAQIQTCLPFVYGGCGGNKNRFKEPDICYRFCTGIKATSTDFDSVEVPLIPLATTSTTTEGAYDCQDSDCSDLQCPFGLEEIHGLDGCTRCRCTNPCEFHKCPEGSRCTIDFIRSSSGEPQAETVCRKTRKPGECPTSSISNLSPKFAAASDCTDRCRDDADCRGDHKCCNNGCALVCMQAEDVFIPATQPEPARILPGPNVTRGSVGKPAELPCRAVGYPKPSVTWWREATMLPLSSSRYEQLPNYSLLIRTLRYEDKGDYSCQAYNGFGPGESFTVTVIIETYGPSNDFVNRQNNPPYETTPSANISSYSPNQGKLRTVSFDKDEVRSSINQDHKPNGNVPLSATISLKDSAPSAGSLIQIDCIVHGPDPEVTWYLDGTVLHSGDRREILPNNTLLVKNAEASDSGEYICSAKHGESVASSSVTLYVEVNSVEDPDCVDSPHFANCKLIVLTKYCSNKFYGKYCCASCKQAGQLHDWPLD